MGRSEMGVATVYQKHRPMLSQYDDVYGLTPARCRKVKSKYSSESVYFLDKIKLED